MSLIRTPEFFLYTIFLGFLDHKFLDFWILFLGVGGPTPPGLGVAYPSEVSITP
jgi:hypothetical protein